jgi:hypothetical protein
VRDEFRILSLEMRWSVSGLSIEILVYDSVMVC